MKTATHDRYNLEPITAVTPDTETEQCAGCRHFIEGEHGDWAGYCTLLSNHVPLLKREAAIVQVVCLSVQESE